MFPYIISRVRAPTGYLYSCWAGKWISEKLSGTERDGSLRVVTISRGWLWRLVTVVDCGGWEAARRVFRRLNQLKWKNSRADASQHSTHPLKYSSPNIHARTWLIYSMDKYTLDVDYILYNCVYDGHEKSTFFLYIYTCYLQMSFEIQESKQADDNLYCIYNSEYAVIIIICSLLFYTILMSFKCN